MICGIAVMGLNGCGKSTLAHAIGKKLGFYEMDIEDYIYLLDNRRNFVENHLEKEK